MKRKIGIRAGKLKEGHAALGMKLIKDDTVDERYLEIDLFKVRLRVGALRKYIKAGDK